MQAVKVDDEATYQRLQTVPGVGKVLGLVLLYELHAVRAFYDRGRVFVVGTAGALSARIGGQAGRRGRQEDWQCAPALSRLGKWRVTL